MLPRWVTFGEVPPEMREPDTYVLVGMAWAGIGILTALAVAWLSPVF